MNRKGKIFGVACAGVLSVGFGIAVNVSTTNRSHVDTLTNQTESTPGLDPTIRNAVQKIPSPPTMVSILRKQGVRVTVDGTALSLTDIAGRTIGYMNNDITSAGESAIANGADEATAVSQASSETQGLQQAVAFDTLSQLLYESAQQQGQVVSTQAAQAYARQTYNVYVNSYEHPSPYVEESLPPPNESNFLSTAAVQSYQFTMTVNQEMAQVVGGSSSTGGSSSSATAGPSAVSSGQTSGDTSGNAPVNDTPALQQWMQERLTNHTVTVNGVLGVTPANIASFLPQGLS